MSAWLQYLKEDRTKEPDIGPRGHICGKIFTQIDDLPAYKGQIEVEDEQINIARWKVDVDKETLEEIPIPLPDPRDEFASKWHYDAVISALRDGGPRLVEMMEDASLISTEVVPIEG